MANTADMIDISKLDPLQFQRAMAEAAEEANAVATQVSPPGAFPHITKLLDSRRAEYGLIDAMFECQPLFDCVWVYQLELNTGESYVPGGVVIKSDQGKARERETSSMGILVSAGLQALDTLKSYNVEPGHIVRFIKLAPFRIQVGFAGKYVHVLQMRVGDLLGSVDLARQLRSGVLRQADIGDGTPDHRYIRAFDQVTSPVKKLPFIPEDS